MPSEPIMTEELVWLISTILSYKGRRHALDPSMDHHRDQAQHHRQAWTADKRAKAHTGKDVNVLREEEDERGPPCRGGPREQGCRLMEVHWTCASWEDCHRIGCHRPAC